MEIGELKIAECLRCGGAVAPDSYEESFVAACVELEYGPEPDLATSEYVDHVGLQTSVKNVREFVVVLKNGSRFTKGERT